MSLHDQIKVAPTATKIDGGEWQDGHNTQATVTVPQGSKTLIHKRP
jgi:NADH:ubiquinone oxidoreductase subunit